MIDYLAYQAGLQSPLQRAMQGYQLGQRRRAQQDAQALNVQQEQQKLQMQNDLAEFAAMENKSVKDYEQFLLKYPALSEANPTEALLGLLAKWSKLGLTTVSELSLGGVSQSPADVSIMYEAARSGRLNARIRAYPFYSIGEEAWDEAGVELGPVVPGEVA